MEVSAPMTPCTGKARSPLSIRAAAGQCDHKAVYRESQVLTMVRAAVGQCAMKAVYRESQVLTIAKGSVQCDHDASYREGQVLTASKGQREVDCGPECSGKASIHSAPV